MKIVIAGAGEVGSHLAKMLSNENQDIVVIDNDQAKLVSLDTYNLMTMLGDPVSFSALENARVGEADLFIAVTPHETRNIISCSMAKDMGAQKTVARIDNDEFLNKRNADYFHKLGVDDLIYPEYFAGLEIMGALKHTWARNWFEMLGGELIVVGVKLRQNAKIVGKRFKEIGGVSNFLHVSAIKHNREIIIPRGDDMISENDIAYISTTRDHLDDVIDICGKRRISVERLMVMGGTPIALQLAKMLGHKARIKLFDRDPERCRVLSETLPNCNVVCSDATNTDVIEDEGIGDCDVFVALTEHSESNILSCIMAKNHGVRKTIAEVENIQFIPEAESLNIGTVINKKLLASSRIFQIMLDSDVDNSKCLALADAEVAELEIKPGAKVTRGQVKDLKLNRDMTIAGLSRNGVGMLVKGDTQLQAGDRVVVFCLSGSLHKIEKIFG